MRWKPFESGGFCRLPKGAVPVHSLNHQVLLERESELERIAVALSTAASGEGQLVVVEAAAGLGKSSLVDAALGLARERGMCALSACGAELERDFAYGVVRQLFEPSLAGVGDAEREQLLGGAAALAGPLFESTAVAVLPSAADPIYPTLHGLYWLVVNLCLARPVMLAVDDAQWADPASLRFLAFMLSRLGELPVALVVALRPGEPGEGAPLTAVVGSPRACSLSPSPLSVDAVARIVCAALQRDPEPEFAAACQRVTAGNPFFLHALARELSIGGVEPTAAQAGRVEALGPRAASRAVLMRLAAVPAGLALTRVAAVLGERAQLREAAALAGLDERTAAAAVDRLTRAAVFKRAPGVEFVHPIVRQAVYADLGQQERAELHARAARVLAAQDAPAERVAAHLLQSTPGGDRRVVDALRAAADAAAVRGAPDVAAEYLRRALREPPAAELQAEVLLTLGCSEALAQPQTAIGHLSDALQRAPDSVTRAAAAVALGRTLVLTGAVKEGAGVLQGLLAKLGRSDRELRLSVEAEMLVATRHSLSAWPRLSGERLADLRREAQDATTPAERGLLGYLALHAALLNEPAAGIVQLAERALANGQLLAERTADSPLYWAPVIALVFCDGFAAAEQACNRALADANTRGSVSAFAIASCWRSNLHYRRGQLADAEADARQALRSANDSWQLGVPLAAAFLGDVLIERGQLDEAEALLERGDYDRVFEDMGGPVEVWLERRGRLRLVRGDTHDGLADTLACGRRHDAWGSRSPSDLGWRSQAALAHAALGEQRQARRLADEELALARSSGAVRALGIALRARGLCEQRDGQIDHLTQAVEVLRSSDATLEYARALTDLGASLRRSNRRSEARAPLEQALGLAHECGATMLYERAGDELKATGARPRSVGLSGIDSLTASERRICQLAARGMTNREIAQSLFVTLKTVETHLSAAYRKLDISSRTEVGAALAAR